MGCGRRGVVVGAGEGSCATLSTDVHNCVDSAPDPALTACGRPRAPVAYRMSASREERWRSRASDLDGSRRAGAPAWRHVGPGHPGVGGGVGMSFGHT